jgi:hypothetical protein
MTIHYHGTPISPRRVLYELAGRSFCASFAAPDDVAVCHQIGQSVMLDNGAFSAWRAGKPTDWPGYYRWCEQWLDCWTTWAVIPDVIGGGPEENDKLLLQWPHAERGAPVWHTDEPLDRLARLCDDWQRVCIGSSAQHPPGTTAWHRVMDKAMNRVCGNGRAPCWIHMLRGMAVAGCGYPFASVDSTDIGRNHHLPHRDAAKMAARWDAVQAPGTWATKPEQLEFAA